MPRVVVYCSNPRLAAKFAYSAALTMVGRADQDSVYMARVTREPFKEMKTILQQRGIMTPLNQGLMGDQMGHAVRTRWGAAAAAALTPVPL